MTILMEEYYLNYNIIKYSIITIAIIGFYKIYQYFIQGKQFTNNSINLKGKVVIITGANSGIGKETALELAKRDAKIILACRDRNRGEQAKNDIIRETKNINVHFKQLDLSSFKSIRNFAKKFLSEDSRLDILINNAGIFHCPYGLTEDGLELQIGVNHFGHFLLTLLLLERLKQSAPSRIITVSSVGHNHGIINKEELLKGEQLLYRPLHAYAQSKLANVLFSNELSRKLIGTGVTSNSLHPGVIVTDIFRFVEEKYYWIPKFLINFISFMFMKTIKSGAQTTIYAALEPTLINVTGEYFENAKLGKMNKMAKDIELSKWLWNISEKVVGESFKN